MLSYLNAVTSAPTLCTIVLLFHVLGEILGPFETLSADVAVERALFRVGRQVSLQFVFTRTLALAYVTYVFLFHATKQQGATRRNIQGAAALQIR